MTNIPLIAILISSTHSIHFADLLGQWILNLINEIGDMKGEVINLRDHQLPPLDEDFCSHCANAPGSEASRWQEILRRFDGFIFVLAEENFAINGALKNALDHAYEEWRFKPFTAVAYGNMGGVRALEALRTIAISLQMVSTRSSVHIGGADFVAVHPSYDVNQPLEAFEDHIVISARAALDELVTWSQILHRVNARPS